MITCIALTTLDSIAICIALLVVNSVESVNGNGWDALGSTIKTVPASIAILVYASIFSWFTIGLFGFHSLLVYRGISTNEYIKGHLDKWNPYDLGPLRNWLGLVKCPKRKAKQQPLPPIREVAVRVATSLAAEDIHLSN